MDKDGMDLAAQIGGWTSRLLADGYCLLPALLPRAAADLDRELAEDFEETPFCEGGFYGARTKRFGRLLSRSPLSESLVRHPLVMGIAERVLAPWCDRIQLNLTQALALHPGALPQMPHRDQDMWRGPTGEIEYLVNVMWAFTAYTKDNGATLVWPGSHGTQALDPAIPGDPVPMEMTPGSALIFLGSTLHGAGGNRTDTVRRGCIVSYCLGWLKPYENQWLAYPPAIARRFSPELAGLAGYRQHRPNLGNFEGQCPSVLLRGTPPRRLAAKDELRPDQSELVAAFVAGQQRQAG